MSRKLKAGILTLCICFGFALAAPVVNADDNDPGQTPTPYCSGPFCWEIM